MEYTGNVLVDSGIEGLPEDTFPVQVLLVLNGVTLDVTDLAAFTVSNTEIATFEGSSDSLTFAARGSVVLEARYGLLAATATFNRTGAFNIESGGANGLWDPHGGHDVDRDGAVPRDTLNMRTIDFVTELESSGVPAGPLKLHNHGASVFDDRDAFYKLFVSVRVTDDSTNATKGMFVPEGWHKGIDAGAALVVWARAGTDMIVVHPDIADAMADSLSNLFASSGDQGLSDPGQVLLEELMHAAVHQAGLQDEFGEDKDAEDKIIQSVIVTVVPAMMRIHALLEKPFDQWTQWDVTRLQNNVLSIRSILGDGHGSLRDAWGDGPVDAFLQALEWEDTDGNGLPDWLDQKLRDAGLDPDNLPETPDDLPGRTPPLPGGNRPNGPLSPVPEPEIVPVDPNE